MDKLTPEQRKRNMQSNKSCGTSIEMLLGKNMWNIGLRYRKNDKSVFGKPDFVFRKCKIAVFCDGDFWHGKDWSIHRDDHKSHADFWHNKIEHTMERDRKVTLQLMNDGWRVIRFWENEINDNPAECANIVKQVYNEFTKQ